jgi:hypothetical protein
LRKNLHDGIAAYPEVFERILIEVAGALGILLNCIIRHRFRIRKPTAVEVFVLADTGYLLYFK